MRLLFKLWLCLLVFPTGHAQIQQRQGQPILSEKYRSCTTGSGFHRGEINEKEFTLREDKPLNGSPTYWESSDVWFLFWCARYSTWMIGHKDTVAKMQESSTCWLVAYSETQGDLNGASKWREWYNGGWRKVEESASITCKPQEITPVCKPAVMPLGAFSYQWDWNNRCDSPHNAPIINFSQVGFGLTTTQALVLQNTHSSSMQFNIRIDDAGKESTSCFSWNATLGNNGNSSDNADDNHTEVGSTSSSSSISGHCHFAFHVFEDARQYMGPFTLLAGEQRAILIDARGNVDGSTTGQSEAMAIFNALPAGESGPWLPFRQVMLKALATETIDFGVSPTTVMVSAAPQSRPGVTPSPQQVRLQLFANLSSNDASMTVRASVHNADHVRLARDVGGGWVEIEVDQYLLDGVGPPAWSSKGADDESYEVLLPFDFPLNGQTYRWLHVHVNGLLSFGNCALPNAAKPRSRTSTEAAIVAVAWKDLVCGSECKGIFLKKDDDKVTVTWGGVTEFTGGSKTLSRFQAEVLATGEVVLRYTTGFAITGAKMGILPMPSGNTLLWDALPDTTVSLVPWLRPQSRTVQAPASLNVEVLAHEVVNRDGRAVPGDTYSANLAFDASPRGTKLIVPVQVVLAAGQSVEVEGLSANAGLPFALVVRGHFPFGDIAAGKLVTASKALTEGSIGCSQAQGLNLGKPVLASTSLLRWTNVTASNAGSYRLCIAVDGDFAGIYSHLVPGYVGVRGLSMLTGKAEVQSRAMVSVKGFVGVNDDLDNARLRILQIAVAGTIASCVEQSTVDQTFFRGGAWAPNKTKSLVPGLYQIPEAGLRKVELTWELSGASRAGARQVCVAIDGNRYMPMGTLPVDGLHLDADAACTAGTTCSLSLQCREGGCSANRDTVSAVALMPLDSACGTAEPVLYGASGNLEDYRVPIMLKSNSWVFETNWPAAAAGTWHVCFCELHERGKICRANPTLKGCNWKDSTLCYWKEEFVSFLGKLTISGSPPPTPTAAQPAVREVYSGSHFRCLAGVSCSIGPFPGLNLFIRNRVRLTSENTSMVPRPPVCHTEPTARITAGLSLPMVGQIPYKTPSFVPPYGGTWQVCYCINERSGCDNDLQEFEHQVATLSISGLLPLKGIPVPWCITGQRCILGPLPGHDLSAHDYLEVMSNLGVAVVPNKLTISGDSLLAVFEPPGLAGGWYSLKHCSKCLKGGKPGHGNPTLVTYGELSVAGPFEIGRSWQCFAKQNCDIGEIGGIVHQDDRLYLDAPPASNCPPKNWQAKDTIAARDRNWKLVAGVWKICYCPKTKQLPCATREAFSAPLGVVIVAGVTSVLEGYGPAGESHDLLFEAVAGTLEEWWSPEKLSVWTVARGTPCSEGSSRAQSRLHATTMTKGDSDILRVSGVDVGSAGPRTACVTIGSAASLAAIDFQAFSAKLDAGNDALAVHSGDAIKLKIVGELLPSSMRLRLTRLPDGAESIDVNVCSSNPIVELASRETQFPTDWSPEIDWGTIPATFPVGVYAACLGWGSISSSFRGAWVVVGTVEVLFPRPSVSSIFPSTVSVGNLLGCSSKCREQVDEDCHLCQLEVAGVNLTSRNSQSGPKVALSFGGPGRCGRFEAENVVPLICDGIANSVEDANETTSQNESSALDNVLDDSRVLTCRALLPATLLPGMHCVLICAGLCQAQRTLDFAEVGSLMVRSGAAPVGRVSMMVGQAQELQVNLKNTSKVQLAYLKQLAHVRLAKNWTCTSGPTTMPFHAKIRYLDAKTKLGTLYFSLRQDTPGERAICLCMRGGTCREAPVEAWEVLGSLVVDASLSSSPGVPGNPTDNGRSGGSQSGSLDGDRTGSFDARKEGPPFALRLRQEFPSDTTKIVDSAIAVVAESLDLPHDKVVILEVLRGSIVIVFRLLACDDVQGSEHTCDEKRALMRWRWRQTLQDPSSAVRVHFGDAVDTKFPAFLDVNSCSGHQLSCGEWVENTVTGEEVDDPSDMRGSTLDGSRNRGSNADERSSTQRENEWFTGWAFAFTASFGSILLVGLTGRLGRRVVRRLRRHHRQKRQRRELQTELPKLQRVDVYADELPDDSCPICLGDLSDGSDLMLLPCNHLLHTDCVFEWLEMRLQCPLCRCPLLIRECVVQNVLPAREGRLQPGQQASSAVTADSSWWILPSTVANRVTVDVQFQSASAAADGQGMTEQLEIQGGMPGQVPSPLRTPEPSVLCPLALPRPSTSPAPTLLGRPSVPSPLMLPAGDAEGAEDVSIDDQGEPALTEVLVEHGLLEPHGRSCSAFEMRNDCASSSLVQPSEIARPGTCPPGICLPADQVLLIDQGSPSNWRAEIRNTLPTGTGCNDGVFQMTECSNAEEDSFIFPDDLLGMIPDELLGNCKVREENKTVSSSPSIFSYEAPGRSSTLGASHSGCSAESLTSLVEYPTAKHSNSSESNKERTRLEEVDQLLSELPSDTGDAHPKSRNGSSSDPQSSGPLPVPTASEASLMSHI